MRAGKCAFSLVAFALVCTALGQIHAAEFSGNSVPIGLFEAIETGQVEAKLILQDENAGRIVLANKTKQPLAIKLPEAFAGVPVLAQRQLGNGITGNDSGNRNNNGSNQGIGGGQGTGFNNGPGIFAIEPEKAIKVKIVAVCLEHGKRSPNPYVEYKLVPLDEFTTDAKVIDVVRSLGRGELDQKAAQAAAWHLANGLSWQQLAKKIGVKHLGGQTEPFFTSAQLERAFAAVEKAASRAAGSASSSSAGGQ